MEQPSLPYAGTSGWSGSDASHERMKREDDDGTTTKRQAIVLSTVASRGEHGLTWKELADSTGWHHGQATGALSVLHKAGRLARLTEKRNRCSLYVLPEYVAGRETATHGRKAAPSAAPEPQAPAMTSKEAAELKYLRGLVEEVREFIKPKWRSYSYQREDLLNDLRKIVK